MGRAIAAIREMRNERDTEVSNELQYRAMTAEKIRAATGMQITPPSSDVVQAASKGYQRYVQPGMEYLEREQISQRRYQVLKDIAKMARMDPRISRMLYKLAADAAYRHFHVVVESAVGKRKQTRALDIINRTRYLIQDEKKLRGWLEAMLRDGDLFLQLIIDGQAKEIERAKKLAAEMTYSRLDAEGNFPKDKAPYYQAHAYNHEQEIRSFQAWEIVHVKWRGEDGQPYGRPVFESARLAYQRVDSGEKNITIRRQLRAGRRQLFNVGTPDNPGTWEEVDQFKEKNKDALDNPQNPITDYYGDGQVSVDSIGGDDTISDTKDIEHFEGLLHIAGFTSQASMSGGRESAANFAVIDSQDEDYLRTLGHIDETVEEGFRQIFDTALLLKGENPDSIEYSFNWGSKDRDSLDKKLMRCGLLIEAGFSHETAYAVADLDNGVSYDAELERIRRQIAAGVVPYNGPNISRGLASAKKDQEDKIRVGDGKGMG